MFTLRLIQSVNIGRLVNVDDVCSGADRFCPLNRLDQNLQADVGNALYENADGLMTTSNARR